MAAAGIDPETAHHVLAVFEAADALRCGNAPGMSGIAHHSRPVSARPRRAASPPGAGTWLCGAGRCGAAAAAEREGWHGEFRLLALVMTGATRL
jgi:hypothetical protein